MATLLETWRVKQKLLQISINPLKVDGQASWKFRPQDENSTGFSSHYSQRCYKRDPEMETRIEYLSEKLQRMI